ncbi:MAG TPA: hypothetical protein VG820_09835 [Fimbriimonadaceae bacterium]|nr:hypothetical protein [Fimbriimonadaceae bacterium]
MRNRPLLAFLAGAMLSSVASAQQYQAVILQCPDTVQNLAQAISGGAGAGSYVASDSFGQRALFWPDLSGSSVDLNPTEADHSYANAVYGNQVGGVFNSALTGGGDHAAFWPDGTADGVIDLHPAGFAGNLSSVCGMDAGSQVGYAEMTLAAFPYISFHPILWTGSAASAVDLLPALDGVSHAIAAGCGGGQQVGWVVFNDGMRPFNSNRSHAFLWTGSAASAVDLHPDAFQASTALATDGNQQVGYGIDASFVSHALLWTGSAASVVDLSPADSLGSRANACRNGFQVGYITDGTGKHAALWNGAAASVINLDTASNSGFTDSIATGISANGVVVGYTNSGLYGSQAVMWVPLNTGENHAPVANAGADQTVEAQGKKTLVTLDGSASSDTDSGDSLTYQWTDEKGHLVGTSAVATVELKLGTRAFTLVVTDSHGTASAPSVTHVTVRDTTAPSILDLSADPRSTEHGEKKWVVVNVRYHLSDKVDPRPQACLSVSASEPCDRGDIVILDAHRLRLRAYRRDQHRNRTYTITVTARDHSGNKSQAGTTVTVVPPSRLRGH